MKPLATLEGLCPLQRTLNFFQSGVVFFLHFKPRRHNLNVTLLDFPRLRCLPGFRMETQIIYSYS